MALTVNLSAFPKPAMTTRFAGIFPSVWMRVLPFFPGDLAVLDQVADGAVERHVHLAGCASGCLDALEQVHDDGIRRNLSDVSDYNLDFHRSSRSARKRGE